MLCSFITHLIHVLHGLLSQIIVNHRLSAPKSYRGLVVSGTRFCMLARFRDQNMHCFLPQSTDAYTLASRRYGLQDRKLASFREGQGQLGPDLSTGAGIGRVAI